MCLGRGVQFIHVMNELLDGSAVLRVIAGHVFRQWQLPGHDLIQRLALHPAPLLRDRVVRATLDLEENRRLRPILVKTNP